MSENKSKSELEFEKEVVDYLTCLEGTKQWEYKSEIKTSEQLWDNFKRILEQNNSSRLTHPLSDTEFSQVKRVINSLETPYKAGQFLYGANGVSEIEIDLDDGEHVFLTVFDQSQIAGGNTVYQVVRQIERPKVIDGKKDRRFDVTLLINGLPIIQIELKKALHTVTESLNQMEQYIAEKQYTGIYSTLQILIAMTPYDSRYMANTTRGKFNKAFAFNWQDMDDAKPVRAWKDFAQKVLTVPMAHELATRYMILDGTKNRESIKVMRSYQVFATKLVLEKVQKYDFKYDDGRLGYVWHTTGSGKTITSFKTAWLASRLPKVDKVVFLVDRIALTNQTADAYQAYDPVAGFEGKSGVVNDTANISDLQSKLTQKSDKNIIVTSIQKMARYVMHESFRPIHENILFIVDEAHRSTGEGKNKKGMLESIRAALPDAAWVGYTGTPKFPETQEIFGDKIHAYTIKEAITDHNVLGFNVEFKETIKAPENPTEEDIDDRLKASVYDTSDEHVKLVVENIFGHWRERSNNGKYNALLTVHVGGNKPSTPRAMQYFDEFQAVNAQRGEGERLKVAVSFSVDSSNGDNQLITNENLHRAIRNYNEIFNTDFDMTNVKGYTDDLARRLNKTADDGNYLDLVIVVDQLLTGFDAPEMNTLYVDRTLKGGNLIQAYSRTNRMHNLQDKPHGNVVNYRWPIENELEMNKAFAIYSDRSSADVQLTLDNLEDVKEANIASGILAEKFSTVEAKAKEVIQELSSLTSDFIVLPASERAQDEVFEKLKQYNSLLGQLKQYTEDDEGNLVSAYQEAEAFYERLGITEDQEVMLTTVLAGELKERRAKKENVDISQVDLAMVHIHDVEIDYDYLTELIVRMANEVHKNELERAKATKEDIRKELAKLDDQKEKSKVSRFVEDVYNEDFTFDDYPVPENKETVNQAIEAHQAASARKLVNDFSYRWGIGNSTPAKVLLELIQRHRIGQDDMNKQNDLTAIMNLAKEDYKDIAVDEVASLSWVKYRNEFKKAFYKLADSIKENE